MDAFIDEKNRQVIPRWRDYQRTVSLGELDPIGNVAKKEIFEGSYLEEKIRDWEANKTTSFASDLVGAAFVFGQHEKATEAAEYLLSNRSGASEVARELANRVLGLGRKSNLNEIDSGLGDSNSSKFYQKVHDLRIRLRKDPRNSLVWADIAHEYATLGISNKAASTMNIAFKLAPLNRFILRSATRLQLHLDDPEQAHDLLRHAPPTRYDPWLLASEIAVACVSDRSSHFVKIGKKMLQSASYSPSEITELASAIGTLELNSGNIKKARKLFRQALLKPNENSVAQAYWASERLSKFYLDQHYLQVPYSFEAKAFNFRQIGKWKEALEQTWKWLYDQPFSSRPATQGSDIAATDLEDFVESENIARVGLIANPGDSLLLNNLAFALTNQDRITEAEKVFRQINFKNLNHNMKIVWFATKGSMNYRRNDPNEGRTSYRKAIEMAAGSDYKRLKAKAAIYLARQEIKSKSPEATNAINFAIKFCKDLPNDLELETLLKRIKS